MNDSFTRRRALQYFSAGGLGAAGLLIAPTAQSSGQAHAQGLPQLPDAPDIHDFTGGEDSLGRSSDGSFIAGDLQVATVTESELTVTWCTWSTERLDQGRPTGAETDGTLRVWPADRPKEAKEMTSEKATSFHVLTVTGLEPGTRYNFAASSHGAVPAPVANIYEGPFDTVTTLDAPSGTLAGTMVATNDTHIGEDRDGIIFGDFPPPATQAPGQRPYGEIMLESVITGAHTAGASHLFVNGDLTAEARPQEVATAKRILDTFNGTWRVTRGNHDRPHDAAGDPEYAAAPRYRGPEPGDPGTDYRDSFGAVFEPRQRAWVQDGPGGVRVLGIDSTHRDDSGGVIAESQFAQIEGILQDDPTRPTVVLLHHPMTRDAQWTNMGGPTFTLENRDAQRLQAMFAAAPGVRLVLGGHTHRVRRNAPDAASGKRPPIYLDTASAKNWPTGAMHLRVFGDRIMVNFRHAVGPEALAWAQRTRWTTFGLQSAYSLGRHTSRNLVVGFE
jgi:Icc protein